MEEDILVIGPSKNSGWSHGFCKAIYRFFAWIGEGILRFPNRFFYAVLVIMCFMAPIFAFILVIGLLCGIYRREKEWQQ